MRNSAAPHRGLDALSEVALTPQAQTMLDAALATNAGSHSWKARKAIEAREIFGLAELAPRGRMIIQHLDLSAEIRLCAGLNVPTPCRTGDDVRIANHCVIGLVYPQDAVTQQTNGRALLEIIAPRNVFHPAVASLPSLPQVMCLGTLPAAIRVTEILLNVYSGLAFQNVDLSAFDALGVMNADAMRYWQEAIARLPLTRKAFLEE